MSKLQGSGTVPDVGSDVIKYEVVDLPSNQSNIIRITLKSVDKITYWKHLTVMAQIGWISSLKISELETKDSKHEDSFDYPSWDLIDHLRLEFWKGGFLGAGAYVTQWSINARDNLGSHIIFTWEKE